MDTKRPQGTLATVAGVSGRFAPLTVVAVVMALVVLATAPMAAASPPYRVRHYDLSPLPWEGLSFHGWPAPRLPSKPPRDAQGVPMYRWIDGKLYFRPGEVAINGMRRLDTYVRTGDTRQLGQALRNAAKLRRVADAARLARWLPFEFDYNGMQAPYYHAMSQGLVLSFFVRLHRITGDTAHLTFARRVFDSFRRLGTSRRPWVARVDGSRHLWLEKNPGGYPAKVLNGHLHATLGLFDYWQETRDRTARRLLLGAITTMHDQLWRFRRPGGLSRYCMTCAGKVKYHAIHIWQVRQLGAITGEAAFYAMAARFVRDSKPSRPGNGRPGGP